MTKTRMMFLAGGFGVLGVSLAVAACSSSDDNGGGTPTTGTDSGADSAPITTTDAGHDAAVCSTTFEGVLTSGGASECSTCATTSCAAGVTACDEDCDCPMAAATFLTCFNATHDIAGCSAKLGTISSATQANLTKLLTCMQGSCTAACAPASDGGADASADGSTGDAGEDAGEDAGDASMQ